MSYASMLCKADLLSAVVKLLQITQTKKSQKCSPVVGINTTNAEGSGASSAPPNEAPPTPNWLAPLLLLLDVWEKTLIQATWMRPPKKVCVCPLAYIK